MDPSRAYSGVNSFYQAMKLQQISDIDTVWANVSWGNYWSWDPKETWALITLMIYAIPLHAESLPWVSSVRAYNFFMIAAFSTVLITYFGVNYILTGMHSYAG